MEKSYVRTPDTAVAIRDGASSTTVTTELVAVAVPRGTDHRDHGAGRHRGPTWDRDARDPHTRNDTSGRSGPELLRTSRALRREDRATYCLPEISTSRRGDRPEDLGGSTGDHERLPSRGTETALSTSHLTRMCTYGPLRASRPTANRCGPRSHVRCPSMTSTNSAARQDRANACGR